MSFQISLRKSFIAVAGFGLALTLAQTSVHAAQVYGYFPWGLIPQDVEIFGKKGNCTQISNEDMAAIQKGEQILCTEDVSGSSWPRVYIYQRVEATPEEAAAVMFDVEASTQYIPSMKYAKIKNFVDAKTLEVDYTMSVPVLSDENYTVKDILSTVTDSTGGKGYRFDWSKIRADSAKEIIGSAVLTQLGTGTLISYINFVKPGMAFAGLFKGRAIEQVKIGVQALSKRITEGHINPDPYLNRELETLRKALAE